MEVGRSYGCALDGRRSWHAEVEGSRAGNIGVVEWVEVWG
jgi:hypothetical protein